MKSFMKSKEENNQQDLFEHRIRLNKGLAWRGAQQRIWVNKGRPIKTEGNYQAKVVNKHVKNLSCQEVVSVPPVRSSRASNGQRRERAKQQRRFNISYRRDKFRA